MLTARAACCRYVLTTSDTPRDKDKDHMKAAISDSPSTYSIHAASTSESPGCFIGEGMSYKHPSLLAALNYVPKNSTHPGFFIVRDVPGKDPARNPGRFSVASHEIQTLLNEKGLPLTEDNALKAFHFLCVTRD